MVETAIARQNGTPAGSMIEQVVIQGDLSKLDTAQRARYYFQVCESIGLNPLTQPFQYLHLNNKLVLYATKGVTDQLRSLRHVSLTIVSREIVNDLYVVTARAVLPDGRCDEEIGAVSIKGLAGEALANAMMKSSTKAKRRVTLSVCGLGMLDESEVESIPGAVRVEAYADQSFAERTGTDPGLIENAPPRQAKPILTAAPAADLDDIDQSGGAMPDGTSEVEPGADRPLYRQYVALRTAAVTAGLDPVEMRTAAPDSVLTDEIAKLKRAMAAKAPAR